MKKQRKIRVALVDDHLLFREGLKDLLLDHEDIDVVAEGENGMRALAIASTVNLDVLISDLFMPTLGGISSIKRLRELHPDLKIIVVSMYEDDEHRREALSAGAWAYHSKMDPVSEIVKTIRKLMRVTPPHIKTPTAVPDFVENDGDLSTHTLTTAEQKVLEELNRAHSNIMIAERLCISERTVKNHLNNIFRKMHVKSRLEAVKKGIEKKWIEITQ